MQLRSKPIRLLLVDDHEVVRAGLKMILSKREDFEIVGEAATKSDALFKAARLKPDVVLLDIRLPDGNGFEACRQIQSMNMDTRILLLTAFGDDETVFEGISAGADGYLLKEIDREKLFEAITSVAAGQSVIDPALTRRVLNRLRSRTSAEPPSEDKLAILSNQERRIVAFVSEGKTNKQIATEMGLSDKTVKNYLSNALDKLKLSRRSQAAAFFVQHSRRD
jgi:two-component system, NarL family, response regulator DevR